MDKAGQSVAAAVVDSVCLLVVDVWPSAQLENTQMGTGCAIVSCQLDSVVFCVSQSLCSECDDSCLTCSGTSMTCLQCRSPLRVLKYGRCIKQCGDGFFSSEGRIRECKGKCKRQYSYSF